MDNNNKPKLEEAGAFWMKTSKTGNNFLTGNIKTKSGDEIKVIVFKNKYKTEGSNQPDYRAYYDQAPSPLVDKKETKKAKPSTEMVASEDIPF